MENTINIAAAGSSPVAGVGLPDALIPERSQVRQMQPGKKVRWGEDLEHLLSRPRPQERRPAYGLSFVGGWLSFLGELTRS